jgi:hypothetical protein
MWLSLFSFLGNAEGMGGWKRKYLPKAQWQSIIYFLETREISINGFCARKNPKTTGINCQSFGDQHDYSIFLRSYKYQNQ